MMPTSLREPRPAHPSAPLRSYLPPFVVLAYTAFFVTGFAPGLGVLQPVPLYLFLCLVLLTLQEALSADRALAHVAYIFVSSAFAVAYAGEIVFRIPKLDFTRNPWTYIILNAVLVAIFVFDLVNRRRRQALARRLARDLVPEASPALNPYAMLASDCAAAALFFFVAALLLDFLGGQVVFRQLGLPLHAPYVIVDLNALLHTSLHAPINLLDGLDFVLGLAATAATGIFLVAAGTALSTTDENDPTEERLALRALLRLAFEQAMFAIRMVLSPLVWLIPAFALAVFAQQMTRYFQLCAAAPGSFLDLLNPLSATGRANFDLGMSVLLLAILAVLGMLLAVAVTEQSQHVFRRTLRVVETLGRGISLSLAFFMYTLALVNIVVVLLGITKVKPFQVGLPGLLLLLVGIGWVIAEVRSDATRHSSAITRDAVPLPAHQPAGQQPSGPATVPIITPDAESH